MTNHQNTATTTTTQPTTNRLADLQLQLGSDVRRMCGVTDAQAQGRGGLPTDSSRSAYAARYAHRALRLSEGRRTWVGFRNAHVQLTHATGTGWKNR